jgi:hypothetical protein
MIDYQIKKIQTKIAKEYIHANHYSRGSHNSPSPCYGLYDKESLIGVIMFAVPCSENVRSSIFGVEHKSKILELHRLHILDVTPKNTESWFISRVFKLLKQDRPDIKAIISFSDPTENHFGTIYRALSAYYIGKSSPANFYRDQDGRLRHPRQNGRNIKLAEALEKGWKQEKRLAKLRYLWILGKSKVETKNLTKICKYDLQKGYNQVVTNKVIEVKDIIQTDWQNEMGLVK